MDPENLAGSARAASDLQSMEPADAKILMEGSFGDRILASRSRKVVAESESGAGEYYQQLRRKRVDHGT